MDDVARTLALPERPDASGPALETSRTRVYHLPAGGGLPEGTEAVVALPDGARLAYAPQDGQAGPGCELEVDPLLRGNQFRPLHESPRAQAALLSIAAGRRLETGPESERVFVFLRGPGLIFLENGDTFPFRAGHVGIVPAGEPARVWAQGPEDVLAMVLQPRMAAIPKRSLMGELRKRGLVGDAAPGP